MDAVHGSGACTARQDAEQKLRLQQLVVFIFLCVLVCFFVFLDGQQEVERSVCPQKEGD
jgi:hypothetical protein